MASTPTPTPIRPKDFAWCREGRRVVRWRFRGIPVPADHVFDVCDEEGTVESLRPTPTGRETEERPKGSVSDHHRRPQAASAERLTHFQRELGAIKRLFLHGTS